MEKVKLGVYVSKELNKELNDLVIQTRNTSSMFSKSGMEFPLNAINKSEIVEEILGEGIKVKRQKILDALRTNLGNIGLEEGAHEMVNSVNLPDSGEYVQEMKEELIKNPSKEYLPKEMYQILAKRLNLSDQQINATMPRDGRNWHENKCQWARAVLKEQGFIDETAKRGIWRFIRSPFYLNNY